MSANLENSGERVGPFDHRCDLKEALWIAKGRRFAGQLGASDTVKAKGPIIVERNDTYGLRAKTSRSMVRVDTS